MDDQWVHLEEIYGGWGEDRFELVKESSPFEAINVREEKAKLHEENLKLMDNIVNMGKEKVKTPPSLFAVYGKPRHLKAMWEDLIEMGYKTSTNLKYSARIQENPTVIFINAGELDQEQAMNEIGSFEEDAFNVLDKTEKFYLPEDYSKFLQHAQDRFEVVKEYYKKEMVIDGEIKVRFFTNDVYLSPSDVEIKITKEEIKELYNHFYSK